MPWYYAGPEAKPIGPVSVEELQACRLRGVVTPDTYVIEHTGQSSDNLSWKRYDDVFPSSSNLPPLPPLPVPPAPTPGPFTAPAHPLFPSAAPATMHHPAFPSAARPDPYYNAKRTNGWCGWGFGLGLAGLLFSLLCGTGLFLALLAVPLCIVGLAQVHKNREQSGQGLAVAGLILACVALLVSLLIILFVDMPMIKAHGLTVTEQTATDSE